MAQTNTKRTVEKRYTHEGGRARVDRPVAHLQQVLNAHLLWEDSFYVDGKTSAEALKQAVLGAIQSDPHATADVIYKARHEMNIRHASLLAAVEYAKLGGVDARDVVRGVIERADELAEVLSMAGGKKAPHAVMKAVRDAFEKFDEYQFAKYRGEGKGITLRDAVFLTHPSPKRVPLVQKIVDGTLKTPNTWETRLSAGEDKAEAFTDLLKQNKLGAMALLRNLRNMTEANVPAYLLQEALNKANWSKVLPFRFMTAAITAPNLAHMLDAPFQKAVKGSAYLPGRTAVLVDTSGSMDHPISNKSVVRRHWAGAALAAAVNGDEVRLFEWADGTREVPNFRSLATALSLQTGNVGHGTHLSQAMHFISPIQWDRVIVLSDMQFADRGRGWSQIGTPRLPSGTKGYTINLAAYTDPGLILGDWTHFSGFSDRVLNYIALKEEQ